MYRLVSRQKQIPNGFVFYQPQTGWKAPRFASFDQIVQALIAHRRANPFLVQKFGWRLDPASVADEVDEFNAKVCVRMGWSDYVSNYLAAGGQPAGDPFTQLQPMSSSLISGLERVAAGGKVIVDWISSGEDAVPKDLAETRAAVCVKCSKNGQGDWTRYFTVPATNAIISALEQRRSWNLSTSQDDKLKVCEACNCPLPLKVHMPYSRIVSKLPQENLDALDPECWIRKEKPSA